MTKIKQNDKKTVNKGSETQKEPMRILQFIGSLNVGGSQSMIMNIYRNIDRTKVQFDFIIDRKDETFFKKEIESYGGRVYTFDECFRGFNYCQYKKQWKVFFMDHPEYHMIHCHVRSLASIVLREAKKNGLKTICHSHNIANGGGIKSVVKKYLQSRIREYCDFYFACSEEAAKWLFGKEIYNSNKCIIVNNAIEIKNYLYNQSYRDEIRKRYNVSDETYLVGHVGRFVPQKNHDFIFGLMKATRNKKDIKYMLCGDGNLKADFQGIARSQGLEDKVIFVPSNNEIYKYYNAFDYFIFPSLYEGLGMVLIEAQYSGLDCLVSPFIPKEAKISDNYKVEELSIPKWKTEISLRKKNSERNKVRLLENAKKYDVKETARMFEQFYTQHTDGPEEAK